MSFVLRTPFMLVDDSLSGQSYLFENPLQMFMANDMAGVIGMFSQIEAALAEGYHVAGYVSYEAGYGFDPHLRPLAAAPNDAPLALMAVFAAPRSVTLPATFTDEPAKVDSIAPAWSRDRYSTAFEQVKHYIEAGDVYQTNLTFPLDIMASGDRLDLFCRLRARQPARYGGLVALSEPWLLSFSPELFFSVDKGQIVTRPMKGTVRRGRDQDEDQLLASSLAKDIKQRAENLMIVDLLRNDLSRVCKIGTVRVPDLFSVETYPTLHTMCSTVTGTLAPGCGWFDILSALFPCGSVTGAPKLRAMEIIHMLESHPRQHYCGAIGYFAPDGGARFNVAIRSLSLFADGNGRYGVGSGVVADSELHTEYDECLLKAKFLTSLI